MTTYYINPETGNDAADGLGWGTAWKTLTNGATTARLGTTDSDEIRIAKSPDPVNMGNVTWTHNSRTITAANLTNVTVDNCESGWTAGLVTPTYSTSYYRQGANSMQAVLAATNGKVCYKTLTSANYSSKSRITFWVNFGTAVNYAAACPIQIRLCSDTAGDTAVNTLTLPGYYYPAAYWLPITIDNVDPLGSSIQSIAIYTTSAVTNTIRFDNIQVIEAASSPNSLALTDVFAKDSDRMWYMAEYIDGTSIAMQTRHATVGTSPSNTRHFYKSLNGTETVTTFKRWGFDPTLQPTAIATTTNINVFQGTAIANYPEKKTYIGGVNPATDAVDGESWFLGNAYGNGLYFSNSQNSVDISNVSMYNFYTGFYIKTAENVVISNTNCINNHFNVELVTGSAFAPGTHKVFDLGIKSMLCGYTAATAATGFKAGAITGSLTALYDNLPILRVDNAVFFNDIASGSIGFMNFGSSAFKFYSTGTIFISANSYRGISFSGNRCYLEINNMVHDTPTGDCSLFLSCPVDNEYYAPHLIKLSGKFGFAMATTSTEFNRRLFSGVNHLVFEGVTPQATIYGNCLAESGTTQFKNVAFVTPSDVKAYHGTGAQASTIHILNFNNTPGDHRIYTGSTASVTGIYTQLQNAFTYSGNSAWRFVSGNTAYTILVPLGDVPASGSGGTVTVSMKIYNQSANRRGGISVLVSSGNIQHPSTVFSTSNGVWETVTVQFTPTENTLASIYGVIPAHSTGSSDIYFDDMQVSQA